MITLVVGCGGINTNPEAAQSTTVIVETIEAGTDELLEVAATVVVQGKRGVVDLRDGWCILRNVPLGDQDPPVAPMTVTAPGYITVSRQIELSKYSYTPVTVEMEEADLATTGTAQGHVTSAAGAPVGSAVVRFTQTDVGGGTEIYGFTDDDGFYIIGGVPTGLVTVTAEAIGYISQTRTEDIFSDASGGNDDIDFVLIGGDTKVDVRGDVVSLTSGELLVGAEVVIAGLPSVFTDIDGEFEVLQVPVGLQVIEVTVDEYDDYSGTITVSPGMDPVHVLMSPRSPDPPPGPYTISGTVTLIGPPDNSGAVVSAWELDRGLDMGSYTTGPDGNYYLFVPPGRYKVEASYGDKAIGRTVELERGRVLTDIDFVLTVE